MSAVRPLLDSVSSSAERLRALTSHLLVETSPDAQGKASVPLTSSLETVLAALEPAAAGSLTVERDFRFEGTVEGDANALSQVWAGLIHNALLAMDGKGVLSLKTEEDQDRVAVTIADTGPGIPPEHLPRLFQPFFTTRPVGHGLGMSLCIAKRIVRRHGGTMKVKSDPGKGTEVQVQLPRAVRLGVNGS
jgi:signal transduction histidine kinase